MTVHITFISHTVKSCSGGWTHNPADRLCYSIFYDSLDYREALAACRSVGAVMAASTSIADNDFLYHLKRYIVMRSWHFFGGRSKL